MKYILFLNSTIIGVSLMFEGLAAPLFALILGAIASTIIMTMLNTIEYDTYDFWKVILILAPLFIDAMVSFLSDWVYIASDSAALLRLLSYVICSVLTLLLGIIQYRSLDKACTASFKEGCFKTLLLDFSVLNVLLIAVLNYKKSEWFLALISNIVFFACGMFVISPSCKWTQTRYARSARMMTDNEEQEQLFGINDCDI